MQAPFEQAIKRRRAAPTPYPQSRFEGRGIVICAGGERYFICAWVLISVLRHVYRCELPIQIWHLGRREMSEEMSALLIEQGVEVIDAETVVAHHPARLAGGWPLKPYAIAQSRFREVLYLDADTVPLVDPQAAFAWREYCDTGLLLWPDLIDIRAENPIWTQLGLEPAERISVDSCILLADKSRVWEILDLAVLMNEHWEEVYDLLYGDKDTFVVSALLANRPFCLLPHRPFPLEWDRVQRDPAGEPFLHHRAGSKWLLNQPNRATATPSLMAPCEAALAELRQRWSGIVFNPPERSQRARAEEARLIGLRTFRYHPAPDDVRNLELLPGGRIGIGAAVERNWAVVERDGRLVLRLYAGHAPFVVLEKSGPGSWRGTNGAPGSEILLQELGACASPCQADETTLRSCRNLVEALLAPSLFALGYEAERAAALETALSLVNEMYDDAPEQIINQIVQRQLPPPWRGLLDQLASKLAAARHRRVAQLRRGKMERLVNPIRYARPVDL
jgi:hypothetical protein